MPSLQVEVREVGRQLSCAGWIVLHILPGQFCPDGDVVLPALTQDTSLI